MELISSAKHGEVMTGKRVQFCIWMRFPEQFCSLRFLESQGKVATGRVALKYLLCMGRWNQLLVHPHSCRLMEGRQTPAHPPANL